MEEKFDKQTRCLELLMSPIQKWAGVASNFSTRSRASSPRKRRHRDSQAAHHAHLLLFFKKKKKKRKEKKKSGTKYTMSKIQEIRNSKSKISRPYKQKVINNTNLDSDDSLKLLTKFPFPMEGVKVRMWQCSWLFKLEMTKSPLAQT